MEIVKITSENYEQEVIKDEKDVLLDFGATWCAPCRMLTPIIEEIAAEQQEKLKVGKVNVDEESILADRLRVNVIPMLVLVRNGQIVKTSVGYQSKDVIERWLKD